MFVPRLRALRQQVVVVVVAGNTKRTAADQAAENTEAAAVADTDTASEAAAEADANGAVTAETGASVDAETMTPSELTTVDNYDKDKVMALIDDSDLPDTRKSLLKTGLENASQNPDALRQVLARIREALNL